MLCDESISAGTSAGGHPEYVRSVRAGRTRQHYHERAATPRVLERRLRRCRLLVKRVERCLQLRIPRGAQLTRGHLRTVLRAGRISVTIQRDHLIWLHAVFPDTLTIRGQPERCT